MELNLDLEEKIKPAINITHGKTLSTEEFQTQLFDYFEEKGIIDDLRSHLRAQMISVLKDTCLGKAIHIKKTEISPKLQALNLLIAEYLLQRNYHYTLSVLSSEVPLTHTFPSMTIDECMYKEQTFRFEENDLWDILEAMGITKVPDFAEQLRLKYKKHEKESLLNCILQTIPIQMEKIDAAKSDNIKQWMCKHDLQAMDFELLLNMFRKIGLETELILQIMDQIKIVIVNEVKKLRKIKDEELHNMKQRISFEASTKLRKYKVKFAALEACYKKEKHRLEDELRQTKENLKDTAKNVSEKYNNINALNDHIKLLEQRLKQQEQTLLTKEQTLQQRQECLENKQKHIDQQFEELISISQAQQIALCEAKAIPKKTKETETKKLQSKTEYVETIEDGCETDRDMASLKVKEENQALKKTTDRMQEEIAILKGQNCAYQNKIQELLIRTNSLLSELELRTEGRRLHCLAVAARTNNPSTSGVLFSGIGRGRNTSSPTYRGGGGEEGGRHVSPLDLQQMPSPRDHDHDRRKKTPRSIIQPSSSSEDISPTEDILKEAKERLMKLECESQALDRHFDSVSRTNLRNVDSNATTIIQNFQANVAMLRESLTRIFQQDISSISKKLGPNKSNKTTLGTSDKDKANENKLLDINVDDVDTISGKVEESGNVDLKTESAKEQEHNRSLESIQSTSPSSPCPTLSELLHSYMSSIDLDNISNLDGISSDVCEWLDVD